MWLQHVVIMNVFAGRCSGEWGWVRDHLLHELSRRLLRCLQQTEQIWSRQVSLSWGSGWGRSEETLDKTGGERSGEEDQSSAIKIIIIIKSNISGMGRQQDLAASEGHEDEWWYDWRWLQACLLPNSEVHSSALSYLLQKKQNQQRSLSLYQILIVKYLGKNT